MEFCLFYREKIEKKNSISATELLAWISQKPKKTLDSATQINVKPKLK